MSELNNWLQHQEDEEFEEFKVKKGNERQTNAAMLAGLGLAVSLGAVAANGNEAKAEEQGQGAHDLLLCTYYNPEAGIGTVINDPESDNDQDPVLDNSLDFGTAQRIYKGYILKPYGEWRVYKRVNGQDIQVGVLNGLNGKVIGGISDSGVAAVSGGYFAKITDTGTTLASELVGETPLSGGHALAAGFVFANYSDAQNYEHLGAVSEEDILNCTDGNIPVASTIQVPVPATTKYSSGLDYDKSTGELVIAMNEGVITIDLTPFLDENGKLPYDFSLSGADFGQFVDFGLSTTGTLASNGYQYFVVSGGQGIIMRTPAQIASTSQIPSDKFTIIDKSQLGNGGKIKSAYELVTGGIYIILDGEQSPVVLHEDGSITVDPGDMTPFIKKCFVIPEEYHDMFKPGPCDGVVCETANECAEVACKPETGDCEETAKPDDTPCVGPTNLCATYHVCKDGVCVGGPTEMTCGDNNGCTEDSCIPATGCSNIPTPGASCNYGDGDDDTADGKCTNTGSCEETPVVNPEPDVVEPEVEPDPEEGPDVVEQEEIIEGELVEEGEIEPGEDVVEASPEELDVVEQKDTSDADSSDGTDAVDMDEAKQEPDIKVDASVDASGDLASEDLIKDDSGDNGDNVGQETGADSSEDDTISADTDPQKKDPGCGCDAGGETPNTANSTFLLGLGLALAGTVARFGNRIRSVLASRK